MFYEGEKQRAKGKQEGAADEPQREEKDEEGEEKQVGCMTDSEIRPGIFRFCGIHRKAGPFERQMERRGDGEIGRIKHS